jgi:hypothetical protein
MSETAQNAEGSTTLKTTPDAVKTFVQNFGKQPAAQATDSTNKSAPNAAAPASVDGKTSTAPDPKTNQSTGQDDKFASKFAALSRREKTLLERENALKNAEKDHQDYLEAKKQAKINPIKYLEAGDLSVDDVVQHALTGKPDEKRVLEDYEKRIKEAEESSRKRVDDLERKLQEREVESFKYSAIEKIKSAGETYEILNAGGNYGLVFDIIQEWHDSEEHKGEILTVEKAAEMAENYFEKEISEKFKGAKKLRKLLGLEEQTEPQPKTAAKTQATDAITQATGKTTTLTNNLTASGSVPKDEKNLTDEERFERAKAMLASSFAKN